MLAFAKRTLLTATLLCTFTYSAKSEPFKAHHRVSLVYKLKELGASLTKQKQTRHDQINFESINGMLSLFIPTLAYISTAFISDISHSLNYDSSYLLNWDLKKKNMQIAGLTAAGLSIAALMLIDHLIRNKIAPSTQEIYHLVLAETDTAVLAQGRACTMYYLEELLDGDAPDTAHLALLTSVKTLIDNRIAQLGNHQA